MLTLKNRKLPLNASWEWAYNNRIPKGKDGYGGWDWGDETPRLRECYNLMVESGKY